MVKKKTKSAPKMPSDQQAKVDQRDHYKAQAKKSDGKYQGETKNTAVYGRTDPSK